MFHIFAKQFETNEAMNKNSKKKKYESYNAEIIKNLVKKYGVSTQFIGQSLRGDRTSLTSDSIVADYKLMEKAAKAAIVEIRDSKKQ